MSTDNTAYGTRVAMTVTNLQSLVSDIIDSFTSWQSDRVDNQTTTKAIDFEIRVSLPTTAHAPANDSAAYVYLIPWFHDGTGWVVGANFGTVTLPTGAEGTALVSEPNSMKGPFVLPYKVTSQIMQGWFTVGQMCSGVVPDGWSLAIRTANCAVAAAQGLTTGCVVEYRPITYTNA